MSSSTFTKQIEWILKEMGAPRPAPFGTHSCKATLLSWAAKFGLPMDQRALLGGHVGGHQVSTLVYSRDELASPLRSLELVLTNVRLGTFDPDSTRSGRWKGSLVQLGETPVPTIAHSSRGDSSTVVPPFNLQPQEQVASEEDVASSSSDSSSSVAASEDLGSLDENVRVAVHCITGVTHKLLTDERGWKLACGRRFTSRYADVSAESDDVHTFCK
eukprot:5243508-Amphidinium_carterae.1